eukprot:TRINITY_DN2211_c0_g2_i2.p2 TRINITY_DN2211_c0_g2~~TRINITY_DN2211_c0_g2_i2.p2  ORF type:complete len:184 (+),score=55.06 TRINITY_DN2211_c0_g2_i2:1258-1809(+)
MGALKPKEEKIENTDEMDTDNDMEPLRTWNASSGQYTTVDDTNAVDDFAQYNAKRYEILSIEQQMDLLGIDASDDDTNAVNDLNHEMNAQNNAKRECLSTDHLSIEQQMDLFDKVPSTGGGLGRGRCSLLWVYDAISALKPKEEKKEKKENTDEIDTDNDMESQRTSSGQCEFIKLKLALLDT